MRKKHIGWLAVAVAAALVGSLIVRADSPADEKTTESAKPVKLGEKSVTVFPVVITPGKNMTPDMRHRLGEVVGMLLERSGMDDVRLGEAEFLPKEGQSPEQVAKAFGEFVASQKIKTPYGLFAEIQGQPKSGVQAIQIVVAEAAGNVVLTETTEREALSRSGPMVPKDPMSCCVFIMGRLKDPWSLSDPLRSNAPRGKVEENWRKKSGLPSDDEFAAMRKREAKLRKQFRESSLEVYPSQKLESSTAAKLAALLGDVGFSTVQAAKQGPNLDVPGSPNEQEVLWRTARRARAYFQENTPSTNHVLVADFSIGQVEGKTKVGAVHWILCDRRGDWVMVDFQNSHHSDFQRLEPDSVEDCLELVKVRLKKRLAAAN